MRRERIEVLPQTIVGEHGYSQALHVSHLVNEQVRIRLSTVTDMPD